MITALKMSLLLYAVIMCALIVSYSPRLVCWCYARKKGKKLENPDKNKIALVVPARNESKSIGALLRSVETQTYPRELFDLHVIVADEGDKTIEMAKKVGGITYVVKDQSCKGDALDHCLKSVIAEDPDKYDAYVIIDADCILENNFIEEMNNALLSGAEVICAKKKVKNYFFGSKKEQTLSACCNAVIWTLIDNMGNAYKSAHGYPCFTVGTGLMLSKKAVNTLGGWPYRATVTEDMELMQDMVLRDWSSFYYEHAVFYMEEATDLSVTDKRRKRWMTGVVDSRRIYSEAHKTDERREEKYMKVYHVTSLNRVYAMMGLSSIFFFSNLIFSAFLLLTESAAMKYAFINSIVGIGFIYGAFFIMTLVALIADYENIKIPFLKKLAVLFVHPIFYMKYIEIVAIAIFTDKGRKWEVIDRVEFGSDSEQSDANAIKK